MANGEKVPDSAAKHGIRRRRVLKGAAAATVVGSVGGAIMAMPSGAQASTTAIGPQWIAFGADPTSEMYVTWAAGTASAAKPTVPAPQIRYGTTSSYGTTRAVDSSKPVPIPSPGTGEPVENTVYNTVLLASLTSGTTYHYSVSNDGDTWSADAAFTTAKAGPSTFRFTAFGDQATSATTAGRMVSLAAAQDPALHVMPGDLAYATPQGIRYPDVNGFHPSLWDSYLKLVGPLGAQSIPWQSSVGAHEVEPLDDFGYAGFITRFPHAYATDSGSPVTFAYRYGSVAFVHLDGNDVSAQETIITGYTAGRQTAWLDRTLAAYRATAGVDFIVVVCNCCCYSSNRNHGSDGGLRDAWGPLFDEYAVDLVISGHVHAYERTNPIRAGQPTRHVAAGGIVHPVTDGTTYICAGGGGNGLYTTWYGTTDSGDAGNSTAPKIWRWSGGDTASGGSGSSREYTDTAKGYSAVRRAVWSCVVVDVTPPAYTGGVTTMQIRTLMPTQTTSAVTSIANPALIDSLTLSRSSRAQPPAPKRFSSGPGNQTFSIS